MRAFRIDIVQVCQRGGVVGAAGFEPATWSTQNSRATRLRYAPDANRAVSIHGSVLPSKTTAADGRPRAGDPRKSPMRDHPRCAAVPGDFRGDPESGGLDQRTFASQLSLEPAETECAATAREK